MICVDYDYKVFNLQLKKKKLSNYKMKYFYYNK